MKKQCRQRYKQMHEQRREKTPQTKRETRMKEDDDMYTGTVLQYEYEHGHAYIHACIHAIQVSVHMQSISPCMRTAC